MSSWKILIVDDDVAVSRILVRVFERAGFETFSASNGEQALNILKFEAGINAMISDIQMPIMNGWELVTHLVEKGPYLPACTFIATSCLHVSERQRLEALEDIQLVEKPISPKQLLRLVSRHLEAAGDDDRPEELRKTA